MYRWQVIDQTQASLREVQQEIKDGRRRSRGVRNSWKSRKMARKLMVHISDGKHMVRESLEMELATSRHELILRRSEILGGPDINGKETGCSNVINIQSLR